MSTHEPLRPDELSRLKKKRRKKKLEEMEIEEEGMYPIHEEYTKEGIIKE